MTISKTPSIRESTNILAAHNSLPSYVVEQVRSLRVRRHGPQQTMLWSQEVAVTTMGEQNTCNIKGGDKATRDARLIKVSTPHGTDGGY